MHVCMYACMYACMSARMHVGAYVYTDVYIEGEGLGIRGGDGASELDRVELSNSLLGCRQDRLGWAMVSAMKPLRLSTIVWRSCPPPRRPPLPDEM